MSDQHIRAAERAVQSGELVRVLHRARIRAGLISVGTRLESGRVDISGGNSKLCLYVGHDFPDYRSELWEITSIDHDSVEMVRVGKRGVTLKHNRKNLRRLGLGYEIHARTHGGRCWEVGDYYSPGKKRRKACACYPTGEGMDLGRLLEMLGAKIVDVLAEAEDAHRDKVYEVYLARGLTWGGRRVLGERLGKVKATTRRRAMGKAKKLWRIEHRHFFDELQFGDPHGHGPNAYLVLDGRIT